MRSRRIGSDLDDYSVASSSALSRQDSFLSFTSNIKANSGRSQHESDTKPGKSLSRSRNRPKQEPSQHSNNGRVKVGIRCRPAFQDEIDFAQGKFFPIVECSNENTVNGEMGRVSLTLISGKQRDFYFDYAFNHTASQDQVYDKIARPVVSEVLRGYNGTIFAYGQTGTGKTYTMGILEFVNNEHAGIIPRALAQIFDHVEKQHGENISISLSFLQIYRETIQDLLYQINGNGSTEENLIIREDPNAGFYVEGLQEFSVCNYSEAEALVNLGLQNRALAPTLMNSTSSRSHTILTLNIEQKLEKKTENRTQGSGYFSTLKSKLLMVDLAGSERVRRTVSKGARLSEAKSINTSLSALGNVISALSEQNTAHIPYRDSKLTRLLQDSLGGTASTALIATVGPAAINYGETLSTLLFASRCMTVKMSPIQHEEVDYAELCVKLQERIMQMEEEYSLKLDQQQSKYEDLLSQVRSELDQAKTGTESFGDASQLTSFSNTSLEILLNHISSNQLNSRGNLNWANEGGFNEPNNNSSTLLQLLGYCFEFISSLSADLFNHLSEISISDDQDSSCVDDLENNMINIHERQKMFESDTFTQQLANENIKIGSHLSFLSHGDAISQINQKISSQRHKPVQIERINFDQLTSSEELACYLIEQQDTITKNVHVAFSYITQLKNSLGLLKDELADQYVERRKREEEVINWSYILKYLLSSSSKLRKQLQTSQERGDYSPPSALGLAPKNFEIGQGKHALDYNHIDPVQNQIQAQAEVQAQAQAHSQTHNQTQINLQEFDTLKGQSASLDSESKENVIALDRIKSRVETAKKKMKVKKSHKKTIEYSDELDTKSQSGSDVASTAFSFRSAATVTSIPIKIAKPPSLFAQEVVQELGVEGEKAVVAMDVIDKVMKLTPAQIQKLDTDTRNQILQIRKELGVDMLLTNPNPVHDSGSKPQRSRSAPRTRSRTFQQSYSQKAFAFDREEEFSQIDALDEKW